MLSFPWDKLKAETLRTMCKDLGAGPAIKRTKEDMIQFLKNIETRGLTVTLQEGEVIGKTSTIAAVDEAKSTKHVAKLPTPSSTEEIHDIDMATSDSSMGSVESTCHCQEGWLSPRMKFILSTTAAVASDLILDTGEMAEELGHVGGVYLAEHIPGDQLPRGKKSVVSWIEGFAAIFGVIHDMFEAEKIPVADALELALSQLPKNKLKLIKAYGKNGAEVDSVLEALVHGAKEEWEENEFEATHCYDNEWDALPKCAEHDLNWTLTEDMLIG